MTELTDIGELYARQNMLEFMMEVFLANELARSDAFSSESFKKDLLDRFRCPEAPDGSDETMALAMRITEVAERMIEKISDRESTIRQAHSGL